jgi:hypothetical protein
MSAPAHEVGNAVTPDVGVFDQFLSQQRYVDTLASTSWLPAILLVACGLVYLFQGWKIFKILVLVNAACLGAILGAHLGNMLQGENMPLYVGLGGAALLSVLAYPTMKYMVSVMGGLAGSLLGYGIWRYAVTALGRRELIAHAWAGALIGLIVLGMLAFVIFRLTVISFTSFQGAVMSVSGVVAMLLKHQEISTVLRNALFTNVHLLPLIVGVPAGIGFIYQDAALVKKVRKRRKRVEGDSSS